MALGIFRNSLQTRYEFSEYQQKLPLFFPNPAEKNYDVVIYLNFRDRPDLIDVF